MLDSLHTVTGTCFVLYRWHDRTRVSGNKKGGRSWYFNMQVNKEFNVDLTVTYEAVTMVADLKC
jgi:hypothetical protein